MPDCSVSTPGMYLYYPSRAQMMPMLRASAAYRRSLRVVRILRCAILS